MPLVFTPEERKALATRLMVQPPASQGEINEFQRYAKAVAKTAGLPVDVLIRLEMLADLAEKGNVVAGYIYTSECNELGIEYPRTFHFKR